MASCEDSENQYLSHLYECLAAAADKNRADVLLKSFAFEELLEMATHKVQRHGTQKVRFQLYGSCVEDLHVVAFQPDLPDFDVMIFPTADELMIDEELIEYYPSHPLHVRIRGTGHPVLQSCLVENTEYVPTSALKNLHPAIFGESGYTINNAGDVAAAFVGSLDSSPGASAKNSLNSPAVKMTINLPDTETFEGTFLNEFESVFHKHDKRGEEESIADCACLSSEADEKPMKMNSECFNYRLLREGKLLFDIIPAFRCLTWPMVAQEWRKRQRKWPSPKVIDTVIREGFHLVVKAPKNGGNPEYDFRISFSHAEYLLSQEINEIQRECYRSLKTYHRVYLSTEPKGLISFHLKNIFLRTIEETGGEIWIESRRAECMWKLFANLLKALRERHLPHYFVPSYNLFGIDYIEDPAILKSLTERVEQIMENPVKFAEELILVERSSPIQEQKQMNSTSKQLQSELMLLSSLKKKNTEQLKKLTVYIGTIKDLFEAANNADCIFENLDTMERTLVEDLRELQEKPRFYTTLKFLLKCCPSVKNSFFCSCSPHTEGNINDINLRQRFLAEVKQHIELLKYFRWLSEAVATVEGPEDFWSQINYNMFNPASANPFDWNLVLPPHLEEDEQKLFLTKMKCYLEALLDVLPKDEDDIPLD